MDQATSFTSSRSQLLDRIEAVSAGSFESVALDVFQFQAVHNPVYASFLSLLGVQPARVQRLDQIPCLPISLFKTHQLQTGSWEPEVVFTSSGTSGVATSRHHVRSTDWYDRLALRSFEKMYGSVRDYVVLALLPAYLERKGSSLVHMAQHFIRASAKKASGFYLHDYDALEEQLQACAKLKQPTLLLGVSFALWDLAERGVTGFPELTVMETGGMKGRRKELTRSELHAILGPAFRQKKIHSEYGMTELLSQAYSRGDGLFEPGATMRVWLREPTDPFAQVKTGKTGAINVIDLANIDSISFIATDDLGRRYTDGTFEVLGRLDASDVRGCNLLVLD
jgi:phenylacetate-coenzyme A ligase PaaK-like adenylate-forming protein